jgi:hypothetical protein
MKNPDKVVRAKYISLFSSITTPNGSGVQTVPVFDMLVPRSVNPIPKIRIVITSQTKVQANTSKCGHDWGCTIAMDVISEQELGFANTAILDDIEEQISNLIDLQTGDVDFSPFICYNTKTLTPTDMSYTTPTKSIGRKVVRYEHQLSGIY